MDDESEPEEVPLDRYKIPDSHKGDYSGQFETITPGDWRPREIELIGGPLDGHTYTLRHATTNNYEAPTLTMNRGLRFIKYRRRGDTKYFDYVGE